MYGGSVPAIPLIRAANRVREVDGPATQAARASPRIASNAARHPLNVRWRTESPLRSAYLGSCIKHPA